MSLNKKFIFDLKEESKEDISEFDMGPFTLGDLKIEGKVDCSYDIFESITSP